MQRREEEMRGVRDQRHCCPSDVILIRKQKASARGKPIPAAASIASGADHLVILTTDGKVSYMYSSPALLFFLSLFRLSLCSARVPCVMSHTCAGVYNGHRQAGAARPHRRALLVRHALVVDRKGEGEGERWKARERCHVMCCLGLVCQGGRTSRVYRLRDSARDTKNESSTEIKSKRTTVQFLK